VRSRQVSLRMWRELLVREYTVEAALITGLELGVPQSTMSFYTDAYDNCDFFWFKSYNYIQAIY